MVNKAYHIFEIISSMQQNHKIHYVCDSIDHSILLTRLSLVRYPWFCSQISQLVQVALVISLLYSVKCVNTLSSSFLSPSVVFPRFASFTLPRQFSIDYFLHL